MLLVTDCAETGQGIPGASGPLLLLDRDGTIIADYPDEQWGSVVEPEFLPGALEALAAWMVAG